MIIWKRKLYRLGIGALFPLIYYFSPTLIPVIILLSLFTGLMLFFEFERYLHPGIWDWVLRHFKGMFKEKPGRLSGTTYFLVASLIVVAFFDKSVAIASLSFLTIGDAASAIIGSKYGKIKILGGRTFEGSLAFFVVCYVFGLILMNSSEVHLSHAMVVWGALSAAVAEVLPVPVDDNLTVALVTALVMNFVA